MKDRQQQLLMRMQVLQQLSGILLRELYSFDEHYPGTSLTSRRDLLLTAEEALSEYYDSLQRYGEESTHG